MGRKKSLDPQIGAVRAEIIGGMAQIGMKRSELAKLTGIPYPTLSAWLNGEHPENIIRMDLGSYWAIQAALNG